MADRTDRMLRRMFVVMVVFTFGFIIVGTFHPGLYEGIGTQLLYWTSKNILTTDWAPYAFLVLFFGAVAVAAVGLSLIFVDAIRDRYRRWREPSWKRYTDPDYRD